jgi:hypothetical protein
MYAPVGIKVKLVSHLMTVTRVTTNTLHACDNNAVTFNCCTLHTSGEAGQSLHDHMTGKSVTSHACDIYVTSCTDS